MNNSIKRYKIYSQIGMFIVTLIWGISFVIIQKALTGIGPFWFIGFRFTAAFAFMICIYYRHLSTTPISTIKTAGTIGLFLFSSYAFQTIGLLYTTASNSGFITGLSVVLVPILGIWLNKSYPDKLTIAGVICSAIGLGFLTLNDSFIINTGDFYTFLCALSLAAHIVLVGRFTSQLDSIQSTCIQIGIVAILGVLGGLFFENIPTHFNGEVLVAFLLTAIPGTALGFLVQNTAQKYITATQTAIILMFEPVFAALAAYLIVGELLSLRQLFGCLLILTGMVISEATALKQIVKSTCNFRGRWQND